MRSPVILVVIVGCVLGGYASSPPPEPVATLDLSSLLPIGQGELDWTTAAFVSETSIAVGLCRKGGGDQCSLSLVRWEGGTLRTYAQTSRFSRGSIRPASEGRILVTGGRSPRELYSADLSTSVRLPPLLFLASQSGKIVAEGPGSWKLYRLSTTLELIRVGTGSLRSISDDVVVLQDGNVMRTETLEGKPLGLFPVESEKKCYNDAMPLGDNRLYLIDCKSERIVDFNGIEQLKLHPPKGCCYYDNSWSTGGKRLLFDYTSRKVSVLRNVGEITLALGTFGAGVGEEWDNRQEVQVIDTTTGGLCFDWRRSFAMGSELGFGDTAAISPQGEFVAIAAENKLAVYKLPAVCEMKK